MAKKCCEMRGIQGMRLEHRDGSEDCMRSESVVRAKLAEILKDERLHYPPALVQINAPLALIQVDLEAKRRTLEWVLGE